VAYECDHHKGLHITGEHVIFETGNNGEIILTDLDNYSFPFLRYRNGDMAVMTDEQCSCGREGTLIKSVAGRTSDNLHTSSGLPVHWGYFHHLLIYTGIGTVRNMIKFQVVQEPNLDILLKIQSDTLNSEDKNLLIRKIREKFGNIGVEIENVDAIPSGESGKFKAVISKLTQ